MGPPRNVECPACPSENQALPPRRRVAVGAVALVERTVPPDYHIAAGSVEVPAGSLPYGHSMPFRMRVLRVAAGEVIE